jgi:hypothetical protein
LVHNDPLVWYLLCSTFYSESVIHETSVYPFDPSRIRCRQAATPADTLVLAWAFDDMITLDPGEAFEISTGEFIGNTYRPAAAL